MFARQTAAILFKPFIAVLAAASLLFASSPLLGQNPYTKADRTWITLTGTVEDVRSDSFLLDYGKGIITVELDDGDRDADAYQLLENDRVTVSGRIDSDTFQTTTIEASSVFVHKLGTTFFASAVDEEDYCIKYLEPVLIYPTTIQGRVSEVGTDEFVIDTGARHVIVDVNQMAYDPLDDLGYQKVEKGDYVRVSGTVDQDFIEGRELVAQTLTEIIDHS